ncbi:MAG: TolC family protein [Planctomycetes bacterium]|nr:TolC family protein [Planctomycetota bacterium]MBM4056684.1 TolC family protein [Planctomycetota bacterium]
MDFIPRRTRPVHPTSRQALVAALIASLLAPGCAPRQPFHFFEDGDLSHYVGAVQKIEYPDSCSPPLDEAAGTVEPLTLSNARFDQIWEVSLEEAIRTALENGKVLRNLGGRFGSFGGPRPQTGEPPVSLLTQPLGTPTVYDPAIVETDPIRGVEPALAFFDAQLASSLTWERQNRPQNVGGIGTQIFQQQFLGDTGNWTTSITKRTATGATLGFANSTLYDNNNSPIRQDGVPSTFTTNYDFTFNQPLLEGAGVTYNRIAGPDPFNNIDGRPIFRGVLLARINADISLADFEAGVRNLVSDTEQSYWELYFAYRNLEARKAGRDSALEAWRRVHALYVEQSRGGEADKEAQAREQYFFFRSDVESALTDVYRCENRLRYMMGISASDGRLIRPADEPTTARIAFDWQQALTEALSRSAELRKQKWVIKQRELELVAAKNLLLPRLDLVGRWRFLGMGQELINQNYTPYDANGQDPLAGTDAYSSLFSGQFQEWQSGAQFLMPLGFRRELATVRHHQLQLARERARLQDEELEASHALVEAVRNVDTNFALSQTNFNRRVAAERQVEAVQAAYDAGTVTFDQLLDAQRRRADAESAYYRAIVDYNRSISQLHFRKGSLLEFNGVFLAEGPWPGKAYFDAYRRARQRDASLYLDYGHSRPGVFSRGPITQRFSDVGASTAVEQLEPRDPATVEEPSPPTGSDGKPGDGRPTPAEEVPAPRPKDPPRGTATLPGNRPLAASVLAPISPLATDGAARVVDGMRGRPLPGSRLIEGPEVAASTQLR